MRIKDSIDDLAKNPSAHMKRLKGERDVPIFSHRVGEYRVLFTLNTPRPGTPESKLGLRDGRCVLKRTYLTSVLHNIRKTQPWR